MNLVFEHSFLKLLAAREAINRNNIIPFQIKILYLLFGFVEYLTISHILFAIETYITYEVLLEKLTKLYNWS